MSYLGFRWEPYDDFKIGAVDYHVPDVLNIFYAEADWHGDLAGEVVLRLGAQFTDQRSVGDDLLTGSAFDTRTAGLSAALGWQGPILGLAATTTDGEEPIRSPFAARPSYLSRMQRDFDRAGEDALGVAFSYHFSRFGLSGVSAAGSYTRGTGARDPAGGGSLPNVQEWDLTFDWRPERGLLRGIWFRLRGAVVKEAGAPKTGKEFRLILNYEIPAL